MPLYTFRCPQGDELEEFHPMGRVPRTTECPTCRQPAKHVIGAGVQIAPSALESKGSAVRAQKRFRTQEERDLDAYKRMRGQGLWPKQIDGAEKVEDRAGSQFDIDMGHLYDRGVTRKRVEEAKEQAAEITGVYA